VGRFLGQGRVRVGSVVLGAQKALNNRFLKEKRRNKPLYREKRVFLSVKESKYYRIMMIC
jgi:hypothetical protein